MNFNECKMEDSMISGLAGLMAISEAMVRERAELRRELKKKRIKGGW